jgi:hypothetical protein
MSFGESPSDNSLDLIGIRFGRGVVIAKEGTKTVNGKTAAWWTLCCDCTNEYHCSTGTLRSGHTKSCGCLRKDVASAAFRKLNQQRADKGRAA